MYCTVFVDNKKTTEEWDQAINEILMPTRHFMIGQKRMYVDSSYSYDILNKVCVLITWKVDGKEYSEYLISDSIDKKTVKDVKEAINLTKPNYAVPAPLY